MHEFACKEKAFNVDNVKRHHLRKMLEVKMKPVTDPISEVAKIKVDDMTISKKQKDLFE